MFKGFQYPSQELIEAIRSTPEEIRTTDVIEDHIKEPVALLQTCKHFATRWSCEGHDPILTIQNHEITKYHPGNPSYIIFIANERGIEILFKLFTLLNDGSMHSCDFNFCYLGNHELGEENYSTNLHVKIDYSLMGMDRKREEQVPDWVSAIERLKSFYPDDFY